MTAIRATGARRASLMHGPDEAAGEAWNGSFAIAAPGCRRRAASRVREALRRRRRRPTLWADFAGSTARLDEVEPRRQRREPARAGDRCGRGRDRRARPGRVARSSRSSSPGTCRSSSSAPGRAGTGATRGSFGRDGRNAWAIAASGLAAARRVGARDRCLAGADPRRPATARTGTRRPCSTSCTTWSTAARSGPTDRRWSATGRSGRGGRRRSATTGRARPVRHPRVLRLPVLQHRRRQLLRLVGAADAVAAARAERSSATSSTTIALDDPEVVSARGDGAIAGPQGRRRGAARRRRTRRRSVPAAEPLPLPGHQHLEGPQQQVRPPGLARRGRPRRPRARREAWPAVVQALDYLARLRPRRRRPARARRRAGPDLRHVVDARARAPTAARSGWRRSGRRSRSGRIGGRRGDGRPTTGDARARAPRPLTRRSSGPAATTVRHERRPVGELGHGRPARRPVVRRRDGPRRLVAARSDRRRPCGRSSTRTSWASRRARWARSTVSVPTGRSMTPASSRPRSGSA